MPRYYFNVKDGFATIDNEGTVLADDPMARAQAVKAMGEMLKEHNQLWDHGWTMQVLDENKEAVCTITVTVETRRAPN